MASLTIRNLPDDVRDRIRLRAAAHGRSMEAEVRAVLVQAFEPPPAEDAVARQRRKIEAARALVRATIPPGTSLVDEFLRERRASWGEND
jgi:plasmid stability protein